MKCQICGTPQKDDLFSAVTQEPACSTCVVGFNLRTPVQPAQIQEVRERLSLKDGEFRQYDRGAAAAAILGR